MHQQRHRGHKVLTLQQRRDNKRVSPRRIEQICMGGPKSDITCFGTTLMPKPERSSNQLRGLIRLQRVCRFDGLDGMGCIDAPPLCHLSIAIFHLVVGSLIISCSCFAPDLCGITKHLLDEIKHVVNTRVMDTTFGSRVEAKITTEG